MCRKKEFKTEVAKAKKEHVHATTPASLSIATTTGFCGQGLLWPEPNKVVFSASFLLHVTTVLTAYFIKCFCNLTKTCYLYRFH